MTQPLLTKLRLEREEAEKGCGAKGNLDRWGEIVDICEEYDLCSECETKIRAIIHFTELVEKAVEELKEEFRGIIIKHIKDNQWMPLSTTGMINRILGEVKE
jgi:hypothetical protein